MSEIIDKKYKQAGLEILREYAKDDISADFEENISSQEFESFFKVVIELTLHMVLNEPQITLELIDSSVRLSKSQIIERYEFQRFSKQDFYCIDGFPSESMPAVVVLPTPMRDGYIYQGLKPAVIVFNEENLEDPDLFEEGTAQVIKEHIEAKYE